MADPAASLERRLEVELTVEKSAAPQFDARFIMSAASADRVKDTIDPNAYKPNLGKRLPALWGHLSDRLPIGYWENIKVQAGKLIGDIKFYSLPFAQMVKTIVKEGGPLGASIGFRGKGEPNDIGGIHFTQIDLLETSLVNVPAHPLAYEIAKQFGITLPEPAGQPPAREHPVSSPPAAAAARSPQRSQHVSKTISELVVETQEKQVALVDKLATESIVLGETAAGTDEFTTQKAIVDGLDAELQAVDGKLASLKAAEARLAQGAKPVAGGEPGANVIHIRDKSKDSENLFGKMALCVFESRIKMMPLDVVASQRFPNSDAVATLVKATVNPAMSNVAGWAQELTRIGYGQFMDLMRGAAILPSVVPQGQQHSFEGNASIIVPTRAGGLTDLSAAFRAEGAPIPVKRTTFDKVTLTPKNMGVIVTATEEMLSRSAIDLAGYFQRTIVADTSTVLDQTFVGNGAGSTTQPAGARNSLAAADTRVSTGATAAAIANDIKLMLTALATANMGGANTRWIMHPKNFVAASWLQVATGAKQFPETAQGQLAGYPVVQSTTMDPAIVLLIDFEFFSFAIGSPQFLASNVATLHEEDTTPLPLATGTSGAGAITAAPVRSLFQTNSWALRMMLDADWAKMRTPGPVQELTAVAW